MPRDQQGGSGKGLLSFCSNYVTMSTPYLIKGSLAPPPRFFMSSVITVLHSLVCMLPLSLPYSSVQEALPGGCRAISEHITWKDQRSDATPSGICLSFELFNIFSLIFTFTEAIHAHDLKIKAY